MSTDNRLRPIRIDGDETAGSLAPLCADYSSLPPRTLLGHAQGTPTEILDGEERLAVQGSSELVDRKKLHDAPSERVTVPRPDMISVVDNSKGGTT